MDNTSNFRKAVCFCFDTVNSFMICWEDPAPLKKAVSICETIEKCLNRFSPGSEIWQINHSGGQPVTVSPLTFDIIQKSIYYSEKTGGVFDISVGAVSSEWNFSGEKEELPSEGKLKRDTNLVDFHKIVAAGGMITVPDGMCLDAGGIAKGYAADLIMEMFKKEGISSALIDLGGNIGAIGLNGEGNRWQAGIVNPNDRSGAAAAVPVSGKFLSTSGIYERFFKKDEKIYHHIIDIKSGMPVDNDLASVSVLSDNGTEGDVLATAFMCMGYERSAEMLESSEHDTEALFIFRDGNRIWYGDPAHVTLAM